MMGVPRTSPSYRSYVLPCIAALCVHALLAVFVTGGFAAQPSQLRSVPPVKIVRASLVELKAVQPQRKRVQKKPAPVAKKKPAPVAKPAEPAKKKIVPKPADPEADRAAERALLEQMLADEEAELAADRERDQVERYVATMSAAIISRWNRPPSARNNMEVLLSIRLVPTGDVVSVSIKRSSGNSALDRSAVLAVEKVERFDMLQGMPGSLFEKHFRTIDIAFRPEDLRL
ncbi:MAG: cell envelope integrity protein TolA [Pseudomonadales bacterium]|nr:TonB C-terminal domain-containing protein [Gammaproteobacteria bacterium]NNL57661.1 cell envelope integrity protein TolA [Pseudomonadales bacterium]